MGDRSAIVFRRDVPRVSQVYTGSSTGFSIVALERPSGFGHGDVEVGDGRHLIDGLVTCCVESVQERMRARRTRAEGK